MLLHRPRIRGAVLAFAGLLFLAGCTQDKPERNLAGTWQIDTEAMQQAGLKLSDELGSRGYTFEIGGTASKNIGSDTVPGRWAIAGRDGSTLMIAFVGRPTKYSELLRVTVLDADHLKITKSDGEGLCYLRRAF